MPEDAANERNNLNKIKKKKKKQIRKESIWNWNIEELDFGIGKLDK